MPDYGKWKSLGPPYNARHSRDPKHPYTDDCLIQLNDFELPEGLTAPQRRKFHRMALARCVAVVFGLDFMTVSCAIARHVVDTYELQELQRPITPINYLLEPVAEVLAFDRAVSQAEPLPLHAQDAQPNVQMHDREQAKEFSKRALPSLDHNPKLHGTPQRVSSAVNPAISLRHA